VVRVYTAQIRVRPVVDREILADQRAAHHPVERLHCIFLIRLVPRVLGQPDPQLEHAAVRRRVLVLEACVPEYVLPPKSAVASWWIGVVAVDELVHNRLGEFEPAGLASGGIGEVEFRSGHDGEGPEELVVVADVFGLVDRQLIARVLVRRYLCFNISLLAFVTCCLRPRDPSHSAHQILEKNQTYKVLVYPDLSLYPVHHKLIVRSIIRVVPVIDQLSKHSTCLPPIVRRKRQHARNARQHILFGGSVFDFLHVKGYELCCEKFGCGAKLVWGWLV
jgi:hypothetical protein